MANIVANSQSFPSNPGYELFAGLRNAFADWKLYHQTLSELRSLNARELADLGISRFALADIARDSVYGK